MSLPNLVPSCEIEPTTGLPIFTEAVAPIRVTTEAYGSDTIRSLGQAEQFIRPVVTTLTQDGLGRIGLSEVIENALLEFEDLRYSYSIPVCGFEYGFIPTDSFVNKAPVPFLEALCYQTVTMPKDLQLAAKVEIVRPADTKLLGEVNTAELPLKRGAIYNAAYSYRSARNTKTGYKLVDIGFSRQFVESNQGATLVDIEPRIAKLS